MGMFSIDIERSACPLMRGMKIVSKEDDKKEAAAIYARTYRTPEYFTKK